MKKSVLFSAAIAAVVCLSLPLTTQAATLAENGSWKQNATGWWYENEDSSYLTSGFYDIQDGDKLSTYYFDGTGYMAKGWKFVGEDWYYFNADGSMKTGWLQSGNTWYYLDPADGAMAKDGYRTIDGVGYIFKSSGAMVSGWTKMGSDYSNYPTWAYCNADGSVYTGWVQDGGKWFYVDNGYMVSNKWINLYNGEDGLYYDYYKKNTADTWVNSYFVGRDGAMITGWYNCDTYTDEFGNVDVGGWMYTNADGSYYTGWLSYYGKWYYIDRDGDMVRGRSYAVGERPSYDADDATKENYLVNNTYVFDKTGAMVTAAGWYSVSDTYGTNWCYALGSGQGYTGWIQDAGNWYYINHGNMLTNQYTQDGYWVDAKGVWR